MKQMTMLENIIINRTGCNRETANLVANDILSVVDKDIECESVKKFVNILKSQAYYPPILEMWTKKVVDVEDIDMELEKILKENEK